METKPGPSDKITPTELRAAFQALNERLDMLETELASMRGAERSRQPAAGSRSRRREYDRLYGEHPAGGDGRQRAANLQDERRAVHEIWGESLA